VGLAGRSKEGWMNRGMDEFPSTLTGNDKGGAPMGMVGGSGDL